MKNGANIALILSFSQIVQCYYPQDLSLANLDRTGDSRRHFFEKVQFFHFCRRKPGGAINATRASVFVSRITADLTGTEQVKVGHARVPDVKDHDGRLGNLVQVGLSSAFKEVRTRCLGHWDCCRPASD